MPDHSDEARIAVSSSWKSIEMTATVSSFPLEKRYTAAEFSIIARGLIPEEMEDKWFIFMQDTTLCFHRSWTGFCIYKVVFERVNDEHLVREAFVNRDLDQYSFRDNSYEANLVGWLIDRLILRNPVPFPMPDNVSKDLPSGIFQHHIAGTAFPEAQSQDKDET
jgi:hypothetical protein